MTSTPPPPRPLLIFDGDCSFCRRWIERWKNLTGDAIEYAPYQEAAERATSVPPENFGKAVHLVEPGGRITRAAEAVFRSLSLAGQKRHLLWMYEHVAPFRWIAEKAYAFIAAHRDPIDRVDRIIVGTETRRSEYVLTRALFLRALGVVYLIAFISMFVQMDGLFGSNGILPAAGMVEWTKQEYGGNRWWMVPTLVHFSASDAFPHAICVTGTVCSALLI